MATPYNINATDLKQFLDDVHSNISVDDETDFKKLLLYLFGFSHNMLSNLATTPNDEDIFAYLERLLSTVELVLSKKKHLINTSITPQDLAIVVPKDSSLYETQSLTELYKWALSFAVQWLEKFSTNMKAANLIKSFLLELTHTVAVSLHSYKYKKSLRSFFLDLLELNLRKLLGQVSQTAMKDDFLPISPSVLALTSHLYTIVNDYEVANRLLLQSADYAQKIENCGKRLAFVLNSKATYITAGENWQELLYNCKSVFLLNLISNVTNDINIKWSSVNIILNSIHEYCSLYSLGRALPSPSTGSYDKVVCSSLMKIFIICRERQLVASFFNSFDLSVLSDTEANATLKFPILISKVLHLIGFQYSLFVNSEQHSHIYHLAAAQFMEPSLDNLRSQILENGPCSVYSSIDFLKEDSSLLESGTSPKMNQPVVKPWLEHVLITIRNEKNQIGNNFSKISSFYTFLSALRNVPCIISANFDYELNLCTKCTTLSKKNVYAHILPTRCLISDLNEALLLYKRVYCDFLLTDKRELIFQNNLLCSNALLSLYSFMASYRIPTADIIDNEPCLKFVLDCVSHHRNRDVRILASRVLPLFIISELDKNLELVFKQIILTVSNIGFLKDLNMNMAESTLLALSNLAIVSQGEWLCVCFIQLIDCLGGPNEQHVNLAYNCLLYVASAKSLTPYKLLSPFLPIIAERIIKKERMLTKLIELLGTTRKFFLSNTRNYTTPRFLEYYKHDFVQEIAEASDMTKLKLVTKTLPRIMATYLCKDELIDAKYIVNVLSNTSPSYKKVTASDLIPNVGELLWFVLLQMQVDDDGIILNEKKIINAITYISKINWLRRPENSQFSIPPDEKEFDYIKDILKEHVLELVQRFSEDVHQMKGIKPYVEKVSAIKAVQFIISRNIDAASWALGQISTCLQAAMENSALEFHALQCWSVLVTNLESRNLVSLFDITISLIFQRFPAFSRKSKIIAAEILDKIFEEIRNKYTKYGPYYYSYPFVKGLDKYFVLDASSVSMLKLKNNISFFPELSRRLQTSNKIIVHQALDDLINSAHTYQLNWQSESLRDEFSEREISDLVRTILDISVHFRTKDVAISTKCAKVLACLGSLDPNKFEFKTTKNQIIMLYDFHDPRENSIFLVDFISNRVIKNFWASNDPVRQLFSVYSMQCFLSVLGLDSSILEPSTQGFRSEVWNSFSETDKSTLTPLLSSRYFAQNPRYEPLTYPHYKVGMRYEKWLVDITTNLLRLPFLSSKNTDKGSSPKDVIFQTCSMLIKNQEISISQHLLKYVTLSHVVNGNSKVCEDVLLEFMQILKVDSTLVVGSERVENLKLCYQSIFEVIDYFNEWVSSATQKISESPLSKSDVEMLKKCRSQVVAFLQKIPTELIAQTSSVCDSYERTVLYLEKCYRENCSGNEAQLEQLDIAGTLQSVYSNIDDFDSLDGVLKKFTSANLKEKLSTFQYNENWSIAQESFQVLSTNGNQEAQNGYLTKLLKSYSDHALYDKALLTLDSRLCVTPFNEIAIDWAEVGLQEALVSGNIDHINKWLFISGAIGVPQNIQGIVKNNFAHGIIFVSQKKYERFESALEKMYSVIGLSLSLSMSSSFSKNTTLMRQLHILFDSACIVDSVKTESTLLSQKLAYILKERLKNTDLEFQSQWQILSMQKLFNGILGRQNQMSNIYISLTKAARKDKRLDIATKCIMNAMILNDREASIEYAYLLWDQGKQADAIKTLAENLQFGDSRKRAQSQLQYALWLDESSHSSSSTIIEEYSKAYKLDKEWDKPFFELGTYYAKLLDSQKDDSGMYERQIIRYYTHALKLGTSYIFEALPKLVTIWLDYAQKPHRNREAARRLDSIILELTKQINEVPVYVWYTCITQLLSRITHKHAESVAIISQIIIKLVVAYPKHSLWYVLSHVKSKDSKRSERIVKILTTAQTEGKLASGINSAKELFEILERLAARKVKKNIRTCTLTGDFNFNDTKKRYDSMVIPVKSNLEIKIPAVHPYSISDRERPTGWHAFPKSASITFDGFDEEVKIFSSLQMPKQITIRGSDNKPYKLMVKRDDTRKDAKVFEFTNMINRLLSKTAEARKRNLVVENYSVIPLAEDMGVIEFVSDVKTMKEVIKLQQKKQGLEVNERALFQRLDEAQKIVKAKNSSNSSAKEDLLELFKEICKKAKPVLHQWYIDQFSDPAVWYLARQMFTRTSAVMSIVGYVIGLGDRHCENILFLKNNGASLHIDFDCLFDKGETLPTPEIVPFRLTQNMVDAMGITGVDGLFRIACEVTGSLVRESEASLMNILETLLYDPLLDWRTHEKPQEHLKKVRNKIRGLLDDKGLPMNIHGQVDVLIQKATSPLNLSQMYGGWAPYS